MFTVFIWVAFNNPLWHSTKIPGYPNPMAFPWNSAKRTGGQLLIECIGLHCLHHGRNFHLEIPSWTTWNGGHRVTCRTCQASHECISTSSRSVETSISSRRSGSGCWGHRVTVRWKHKIFTWKSELKVTSKPCWTHKIDVRKSPLSQWISNNGCAVSLHSWFQQRKVAQSTYMCLT